MRRLLLFLCLSPLSIAAQAPCATDAHRQLDYWIGDWDLTWAAGPDSTGVGTNTITASHGGCVVEERFTDLGNGFAGHSVSMYDARAGQWRQTWVDNQGSYLVLSGQPTDDGTLDLRTPAFTTPQGVRQVNRMIWDDVTPDALTWRWQRSTDDGATWTDAWVIRYTRRR